MITLSGLPFENVFVSVRVCTELLVWWQPQHPGRKSNWDAQQKSVYRSTSMIQTPTTLTRISHVEAPVFSSIPEL